MFVKPRESFKKIKLISNNIKCSPSTLKIYFVDGKYKQQNCYFCKSSLTLFKIHSAQVCQIYKNWLSPIKERIYWLLKYIIHFLYEQTRNFERSMLYYCILILDTWINYDWTYKLFYIKKLFLILNGPVQLNTQKVLLKYLKINLTNLTIIFWNKTFKNDTVKNFHILAINLSVVYDLMILQNYFQILS